MTLARYVRLVVRFHCQEIFPENKDFLQWTKRKEEFFEEEAALLLGGAALDQLLAATVRKLKKLDLIEYQVFIATWSSFSVNSALSYTHVETDKPKIKKCATPSANKKPFEYARFHISTYLSNNSSHDNAVYPVRAFKNDSRAASHGMAFHIQNA